MSTCLDYNSLVVLGLNNKSYWKRCPKGDPFWFISLNPLVSVTRVNYHLTRLFGFLLHYFGNPSPQPNTQCYVTHISHSIRADCLCDTIHNVNSYAFLIKKRIEWKVNVLEALMFVSVRASGKDFERLVDWESRQQVAFLPHFGSSTLKHSRQCQRCQFLYFYWP